jgi:hypothetical protein
MTALPLAFQPFKSFWSLPAKPVQLGLDVLRQQYAIAVNAGVLRRSLIDSAKFEQWLADTERLALGPLARGV